MLAVAVVSRTPAASQPYTGRRQSQSRLCTGRLGAARSSMAVAALPQLNYIPIRGRGEPIRLTLAALELDWEEVHWGHWVDTDPEGNQRFINIDWASEFKKDTNLFPFNQAPSYTVNGETYSQSNAIVRHLGRKHDLYGASEHDSLRADAILDGIDDIRRKYFMVVYSGMMQPGGLDSYWQRTCDPATVGGFNGGAHFEFLNRIIKKSRGTTGFAVGEQLTIADLLLFDIVDCHLPLYPEKFPHQFPELTAHWGKIKELPAIAKYIKSDKRYPHVLGTNVIENDKVISENVEAKKQPVSAFQQKMAGKK